MAYLIEQLAVSNATGTLPGTSGTTLNLQPGEGADRFPTPAVVGGNYYILIEPEDEQPTPENSEIALVTARATDALTITRAQRGSTARDVQDGDMVSMLPLPTGGGGTSYPGAYPILNADISTSAAIAVSKLAPAGTNGYVLTTTAGVPGWAAPTGGGGYAGSYPIVNADIAAAAAVDWTKISKVGSSLADLATRSAADLNSGTLPAARLPVFVASGASHAIGAVPDPGVSAGTTKFLREDASWQVPSNATITLSGDVTGSGTSAITTAIAAGVVVDADVNASAAIAWTKISKTGSSLVDLATRSASDLNSGTLPNARLSAVPYSALTLTGSIVNADIATAAAIAWSKIDKTGSSLADLTTRSATDLTSGTLPNARLTAVPYSALTLTGSIVNADVATAAAIAYSKLNLSNSIVNADIASGAAIAKSKLASLSIVDADVAAGAAIAVSKLAAGTNTYVLTTVGTTPTWAAPTGGTSSTSKAPAFFLGLCA